MERQKKIRCSRCGYETQLDEHEYDFTCAICGSKEFKMITDEEEKLSKELNRQVDALDLAVINVYLAELRVKTEEQIWEFINNYDLDTRLNHIEYFLEAKRIYNERKKQEE